MEAKPPDNVVGVSHWGVSILVLLALAAAVSVAAAGAIHSNDFGWHLQAGRWILEHGGPPRTDPLSFTTGDRPWIDHEWLFQALLAYVVQRADLLGAWLLKLTAAAVAVLLPAVWLLWRRQSLLLASCLCVVAMEGARFRFLARPEVLGLVLLPLVLILLMAARERAAAGRTPYPALAPLLPLLILWANLHPSALMGAATVIIFSVALIVEERRWSVGGPFIIMAALSPVCLLANPYGASLLGVPGVIRDALSHPGITNPEWGSALQTRFWLFWVVLAALVAWLVALWRWGETLDLPSLACLTFLAALAATAGRTLAFFYVALPLLVGAPVGLLQARGWQPGRWARPAAVLLPLVAAAWFLQTPGTAPAALGPYLQPGRFPVAMAAAFRELDIRGPIYNPVRYGGYLAWALAPEKVFLDGRNEMHAKLLGRLADCRAGSDLSCWEGVLQEWRVEAAFVEYDPRRIPVRLSDGRMVSRSAAAVYFRRHLWALVDWDDTAMLFVRRQGRNSGLIALREDRTLTPDDPEGFAADLESGHLNYGLAQVEVNRRLGRRPDSWRARRLEQILAAYGRAHPEKAGEKGWQTGDKQRPGDNG